MPGSIQSIERAAAVLHVLGAVPAPVALGELAQMLGLPKPTVHGIVRTLVDVGFAAQDSETGRYYLGHGISALTDGIDPHLLRSRATNWADGLAARSGLEVQLGILEGHSVSMLHHVFRPDRTPQVLRVGELLPLHATALGHILLAFSPAVARVDQLELTSYTPTTPTRRAALSAAVHRAQRQGWAVTDETHRVGVAAIAAPIRHHVGIGVGALAVAGPREQVLTPAGEARPDLVGHLVGAANEIAATLHERL